MKLALVLVAVATWGQSALASEVKQHCLSDGETKACFLEVVEDGRSFLKATAQDYPKLVLNENIAKLNYEFERIDAQTYSQLYKAQEATTYLYQTSNPGRIDAYTFDAFANCNEKDRPEEEEGGWWDDWGKCTAGTVGGAIGGGIAGLGVGGGIGAVVGAAATGPAAPAGAAVGAVIGGAAVGAVGGALAGAAMSCGSVLVVHTKDGFYNEESSCR